ncbi:MAG: right-handed parallel beta-helix repeat-containing protein [Candidatus Hydrogenedentes bacterium]|nr:right-handed parallel beta-helix repeat-containing protein [Candidatus Hydrogenedentota bacterium]
MPSPFHPGSIAAKPKSASVVDSVLGWLVLILLLAPGLHATSYYIDPAKGADTNTGVSQDTPWKHLARLQREELSPGDIVHLRRGAIFRETLHTSASGTPDQPITYSAYGEGEAPSLRGSDTFNDPRDWSEKSPGLWYAIGFEHDPGMIVHDGTTGRRIEGEDTATTPWDYWYDAARKRIYVRNDRNPATAAKSLEIPVREYTIAPQEHSHIVFQDLDFRQPWHMAWAGWKANGVTFKNCSFSHSPGNHLQFQMGARDGRVAGCRFDDWNLEDKRNYAIQAINEGTGPIDIEDCAFTATRAGGGEDHTAIMNDENSWVRSVRRCTFDGQHGNLADDGIVIWHLAQQATEVTIEDNTLRGLGGSAIIVQELEHHGAAPAVTVRRNRIEEVCLRDDLDKEALRLRVFTPASRVLAHHNVIRGSFDGRNDHFGIGITEASGVRLYHNLITGTDNAIHLKSSARDAIIANNIVTKNRGFGIAVQPGSTVVLLENNCFHENGGGDSQYVDLPASNLSADPQLQPDGTLAPGSPCTGAGRMLEEFSTTGAPNIGP